MTTEYWEPWQPHLGDLVHFRMGEREAVYCPKCHLVQDRCQDLVEASAQGHYFIVDTIFDDPTWECEHCGHRAVTPAGIAGMRYGIVLPGEDDGWLAAAIELTLIHNCDEGWICEEHQNYPFPHDDCAGPGMPCEAVDCEPGVRLIALAEGFDD